MKRLAACLVLLGPAAAVGGEIAGLPASLPPTIERPLEINFSNDFLGRGGSSDDFRTQQLILMAEFGERWILIADHSVLTLEETSERLDQLAASVGYHAIDSASVDTINRLTFGAGLRGVGEFGGERMQNGFHRLVGSDIEFLSYTGTRRTDVTVWADAQRYRLLTQTEGGIRFGYWLRASSLSTWDGQFDSAAAGYAVATRGSFDAWLGLRRDWRSGYDDPVLARTAAAEDDLAIAIGLRWGVLVLETVQQLDNDASYGQLRLLAGQSGEPPSSAPRAGFEAGFLLPDVHVHLAARYRPAFLARGASAWRRSLIAALDYGEPQFPGDATLYVQSTQLSLGVEWERGLGSGWASVYASAGAGLRRERLLGDGDRDGLRSDTADRAVLTTAAGLRFHAAPLADRWNYRLQLGVQGWLPTSGARLDIDGEQFDAQEPSLAAMLGMTFDLH